MVTDVNEPLPLMKVSEGNLSLRLTLNFMYLSLYVMSRFFFRGWSVVGETGLGCGTGSVIKQRENENFNRPVLEHVCV